MAKYTVTMVSRSQWVGTEMENEDWLGQVFDTKEEAQEAIDKMASDELEAAWQAAVEDQGVEYEFRIDES